MFMRSTLIAAAAVIGISGAASAATMYTAHSHQKGDNNHSLWFGETVDGAGDSRHFKFENTEPGYGSFKLDGDSAVLKGIVENADGAQFEMHVEFERTEDPGVYKEGGSAVNDTWSFWKISMGMLTSLTDGMASFDLIMRGYKDDKPLAVQLGVGANDKDADLFGLSTWFIAKEKGCEIYRRGYTIDGQKCERYRGDINIVLKEDDGGGGIVPLPASIVMLPAALGLLGAAGGVARRRRNS